MVETTEERTGSVGLRGLMLHSTSLLLSVSWILLDVRIAMKVISAESILLRDLRILRRRSNAYMRRIGF